MKKIINLQNSEEALNHITQHVNENVNTIRKINKDIEDRIELAQRQYLTDKPWGGFMPAESVELPENKLEEIAKESAEKYELTCPVNIYAFTENNQDYYGFICFIADINGDIISPNVKTLETLASLLLKSEEAAKNMYMGAKIKPILNTILEEDRITEEERESLNKMLNSGLKDFGPSDLLPINVGNVIYRGLTEDEKSRLIELLK